MIRAGLIAIALSQASPALAGSFKMVTLDFPPLEYANEKNEAAGAAVELVTEIMKELKHSVHVQVLPWTRSMMLTKEGKADAIFTCYKNPEREGFLDFGVEVLVPQVVSLYVKKGSKATFNGDLKELIPFKIGILNTISYGQVFDKAKDDLKLKTERVEALDQNFKKLAAGRIDFVISNRYSATVELDRLKLQDEIVELPRAVEVIPSYIAFSKAKKLAALRDEFDKVLRSFKRSGRYHEILEKYKVRAPRES